MNLVKSLIQLLKKNDADQLQESPEGVCPNCWGRTEYGGHFFTAVKKHQVDINSKSPNVGWIQDYAEKNLSAIVLTPKEDVLVCETCKVSYRPTI